MNEFWNELRLSDIADLTTGSRERGGARSEGVPSIGGEHILDNGSIAFDKMKFVSREHYETMRSGRLQPGDVLLVKDGATTGKTGYWGRQIDASVNEHIFVLRAKPGVVLPYYLYLLVQGVEFQRHLRPLVKGVIGGVTRAIGEMHVRIPDVARQAEVVDLITDLDQLLVAVENETAACRRLLNAARLRLLESDVFVGEGLTLAELTAATRPICYGVLQPGAYIEGGPTLIRIQDMKGNRVSVRDAYRISDSLNDQYERSRLVGGEVLVSIRGTLGRVALCPREAEGGNVSRDVALIVPDERVSPAYVRHVLLAVFEKRGISSAGSTRPSLNIGDLRRTVIPVPAGGDEGITSELNACEGLLESLQGEAAALRSLREALVTDLVGAPRASEVQTRDLSTV